MLRVNEHACSNHYCCIVHVPSIELLESRDNLPWRRDDEMMESDGMSAYDVFLPADVVDDGFGLDSI